LRHTEKLAEDGGWETEVVNRLSAVEAVGSLIPSEQAVIQLRYYDHCTDGDIARRLGLPLGTVKGRLRSGLKHIRQAL